MENKKLWFRAKQYGWGWTPVTWQGWAITILYIIPIILFSTTAAKNPVIATYIIDDFFVLFAINTIFLFIICYTKGEKPRWRWGDKENN